METPWTTNSQASRASFTGRFSGLLGRRDTLSSNAEPTRHTATYEVPLFLSPARYDPNQLDANGLQGSRQSRSLRQSFVQATTSMFGRLHASSMPSPSRYSDSEGSPGLPTISAPVPAQVCHTAPATSTEVSTSAASSAQHVKRRRRSGPSIRRRLQTLRQLSIAFGVTLLVAMITYLVLALSGIASGIAFHVITIIFLLILIGLFLNSSIRLVLLTRRAKLRKHRHRHRHDRREPKVLDEEHGAADEWMNRQADPHEDFVIDKPMAILTEEDDPRPEMEQANIVGNMQLPPPVYGNFRGSKRINPELVGWREVCVSPRSPTYAEAVSDVHRAMGYRPPSYALTEGDATYIMGSHVGSSNGVAGVVFPTWRKPVTPFTAGSI